MHTPSPAGALQEGAPLCIHEFEQYNHDCDVCRHTRKIAPKLKQSALLKLISEAQLSLEAIPRKPDTEREQRKQANLARMARALRGEHTRVRRAG